MKVVKGVDYMSLEAYRVPHLLSVMKALTTLKSIGYDYMDFTARHFVWHNASQSVTIIDWEDAKREAQPPPGTTPTVGVRGVRWRVDASFEACAATLDAEGRTWGSRRTKGAPNAAFRNALRDLAHLCGGGSGASRTG